MQDSTTLCRTGSRPAGEGAASGVDCEIDLERTTLGKPSNQITRDG